MSWLPQRAREANSRMAEIPRELKQQTSPVGPLSRGGRWVAGPQYSKVEQEQELRNTLRNFESFVSIS